MVCVLYLQQTHRRADLRQGQQRAAPAAEQGLGGHLRPRGSQHHREAPGLRDHVPGSILHPARGGPGLARGGPTAWPVARRGAAEPGMNPDPGRFIEVNGISLYVEEHGAGVPVLLMHGFPHSARLWRNQVPFLVRNGFRVTKAAEWAWLRTFSRGGGDTGEWIEDVCRPGALAAALNWARATLAPRMPGPQPSLPPVQAPVLGIWSDGDHYLDGERMRQSAAWVTGPWRYAEIAGASHWVPRDAPAQLNDLLLDWLR